MYVGHLTSAGHRTLLAWFIPGTANVVGAAAHLFGHVEVQLSITCHVVRVKVPVAVTLPHVCVYKNDRVKAHKCHKITAVSLINRGMQAYPCSCSLHWLACSPQGRYRCSSLWCYSTGLGHRCLVAHTHRHLCTERDRQTTYSDGGMSAFKNTRITLWSMIWCNRCFNATSVWHDLVRLDYKSSSITGTAKQQMLFVPPCPANNGAANWLKTS